MNSLCAQFTFILKYYKRDQKRGRNCVAYIHTNAPLLPLFRCEATIAALDPGATLKKVIIRNNLSGKAVVAWELKKEIDE